MRATLQRTLAMILAGGPGSGLSILGAERTVPAVPFGGKYRIIDFALSNLINSGLYNVTILTQYRPRSLNDHIRKGDPWDLDRLRGGVRLLQPYLGRGGFGWYRGRADAVYRNLSVIEECPCDAVLVLMGDHVYKMDFALMLDFHNARSADVTLAVREVPWEEASRYGITELAPDGRVVRFEEKPSVPKTNKASMGVYLFNKEFLVQRLREAAQKQPLGDFETEIFPTMAERDRMFAYEFHGYWRDVGTIPSYWQANMDLLAEVPPLDLYDTSWLIHTRSEERAPAKVRPGSRVARSLICHGCIVEGTVERSILSPGVRVAPGAVVRDSIVMTDSQIGREAVLDHAILDKEVHVGPGAVIGWGDDYTPNREEPERLFMGLTLVGKRARVPTGARLGRNVKVMPGAREGDFPALLIPSGETVAAS